MQNEQIDRLKLLFSVPNIALEEPVEGAKRKFKGTAYAGGLVDGHWYWGRQGVVFDLDNIQINTPSPLLEEHGGSTRIGVVTEVSLENGIHVSGDFLTNDDAKRIVQDSDDGFPFQMSIFIDPESIEEVASGSTVNVNGQTFTGPITVFRKNRIREFTICTTGADTQTSIKAFSGKKPEQPQQEDTNVTELELAKEAQKQAETERDKAVEELKQFKAKKRADEIAQLEKDVGKQFSAEDKTAYTNMDDSTFAFSAKQVRQFSAKPEPVEQKTTLPGYLFEHQATGGAQEQNQFTAKPKSLADMAKDRK